MRNIIYCSLLALIFSCTPKVPETMVATPPTPPATPETKTDPSLSPCTNWLNAPNMDDLRRSHVLYRDGMKRIAALQENAEPDEAAIAKEHQETFKNWYFVYQQAPAADGKRATHYEDGIVLYDHKYFNEEQAEKKAIYMDSIKVLYNEMMECYGDEGYVYSSMAYDFYYRYEGEMSDIEVFQMYKKSFDAYDADVKDYVLMPLTALMVNGLQNGTITEEEAKTYAPKIQMALQKGLEGCSAKGNCLDWESASEDINARLALLEQRKGFFGCEYFKEKYLTEESASGDCDQLASIIGRLRWGGCALEDVGLAPLIAKYQSDCVVASEPTVTCRSLLQEGDSQGAIDCYLEKASTMTDMEKRSQYHMVVAKIYYGELKQFSKARTYALKAAQDKPNWGDPYILIGKLYASSGPLCGPGRGWDSQIVTWPAIDMWRKAKSVDPSTAAEANKMIRRYEQFMPDISQIFIRSLKEGDTFRVPCWIQRDTKIRAAK